MTVRNVKKNLAGQQDLLPGVGPYSQTRRGVAVSMDGPAKSYIELWKSYCGDAYVGTFEDGFTAITGNVAVSLILGRAYRYIGVTQITVAKDSSPDINWHELVVSTDSLLAREALRHSYAEAGYNVVGTFQAGFTYINANDVGIDETTGKGYTGPAGDVAAGTDPTSGVYIDRSLSSEGALYATVSDIAEGRFPVGKHVAVTDRALAVFKIVSGGVANGYSILNAGAGLTAELIVQDTVQLEWLGDTTGDCRVLFEHASQKYKSIKLNAGKTYLFTLSRVFAGTEVFAHGAIFKNANTYGIMFLNGEWGNGTYATGYNGDGNITFHGGEYDCSGVAGGAGLAGAFAFGHGRNIKLFDPIFKNGVGTHYVEINGCQNVHIIRPVVINHLYPGSPTPGWYENFQIDHMGSSSQFGYFGSYDNTPCDNIHIVDFDSNTPDVVVGTHTPAVAGNPHTNIFISGIARVPAVYVVQAMTWKGGKIDVRANDCSNDSVKMSGGCEELEVNVTQLSPSTGGQSVIKAEEVVAMKNRNIKVNLFADTINAANAIRLNKVQGVSVSAQVTVCYGGLINANNALILDINCVVSDGGKNGGNIVTLTDTIAKSSRMILEGTTHARPLSVSHSGLIASHKIKLNGVTWADGTSGDGQPSIIPGVELNGHTSLLSSDPVANTGTATIAHNCQNFSHFLVTTGTASGGDLKTVMVKPYSFPDYIGKPLCIDAFSGHGTITFTNATTITWTTPNPLRAVVGVNMT